MSDHGIGIIVGLIAVTFVLIIYGLASLFSAVAPIVTAISLAVPIAYAIWVIWETILAFHMGGRMIIATICRLIKGTIATYLTYSLSHSFAQNIHEAFLVDIESCGILKLFELVFGSFFEVCIYIIILGIILLIDHGTHWLEVYLADEADFVVVPNILAVGGTIAVLFLLL